MERILKFLARYLNVRAEVLDIIQIKSKELNRKYSLLILSFSIFGKTHITSVIVDSPKQFYLGQEVILNLLRTSVEFTKEDEFLLQDYKNNFSYYNLSIIDRLVKQEGNLLLALKTYKLMLGK